MNSLLLLDTVQWIIIGVAAAVVVVLAVVFIAVACSRKKKSAQTENAAQAEAEPAETVEAEEEVSAEEIAEAEEIEREPDEPEETEPTKEKAEKKAPATKVYHIGKRKSDGKWQVKAAKGAKAVKLFNTQAEAIEYAKKLALSQEARIIIHKEDGSFRKLTYKKK